MALTVGHITYANCVPFFYYLRECGFGGAIVNGVPAELNRMLAEGELDICPSSSIEYARNAENYYLIPDQSISSVGPVQSVLLFTDRPLQELDGVPISITGESATSVALLKVLLKEFFQLSDVVCQKENDMSEEADIRTFPTLLIGDRALRASTRKQAACLAIDLGELWYHFTGLPFVFALWIVKRSAAEKRSGEVAEFTDQLKLSRKKAFDSLAEIAALSSEKEWLGAESLVEYWKRVSYDLDPLHIEGLRCFYLLLEKHGLIEEVPELRFFNSSL